MSRIVKIYIADDDENIPLEKRVLYESDMIHTDKTDQELLWPIDVESLLVAHNKYRATIKHAKYSQKQARDVFLLPLDGSRDLRIRIVQHVQF